MTLKISLINILLSFFSCQQQSISNAPSSKIDYQSFHLTYVFAGLGSNLGDKGETIRIKGTRLIYTLEQNSSWTGEISKDNIDTILVKTFRTTSIDSIKSILGNIKDTMIYQTNPCIMSGGIHYLTVAFDKDTTAFILKNTFDYTALKVVDILNSYLPVDKKLWADEQMIKNEQDCWESMSKRLNTSGKK